MNAAANAASQRRDPVRKYSCSAHNPIGIHPFIKTCRCVVCASRYGVSSKASPASTAASVRPTSDRTSRNMPNPASAYDEMYATL